MKSNTQKQLEEIRNEFTELYKIIKQLEDDFGDIKKVEPLYYPYFYNKYDESAPTSQLTIEYKSGQRLVLFSGLYWRLSGITTNIILLTPVEKEKVFDSDGICYAEEQYMIDKHKYFTEEQLDAVEDVLWNNKNEFDWLCERLLRETGIININTTINLNKYNKNDRECLEKALKIIGITKG